MTWKEVDSGPMAENLAVLLHRMHISATTDTVEFDTHPSSRIPESTMLWLGMVVVSCCYLLMCGYSFIDVLLMSAFFIGLQPANDLFHMDDYDTVRYLAGS